MLIDTEFFIFFFKNNEFKSLVCLKKSPLTSGYHALENFSFYHENTEFSDEEIANLMLNEYLKTRDNEYAILLTAADLNNLFDSYDSETIAEFLVSMQKSKQKFNFTTKKQLLDFINNEIYMITEISEKLDKTKVSETPIIKGQNDKDKLPPISEIVNKINSRIINQEEAVRKATLALYRNIMLANMDYSLSERITLKENILISGPSGCGKTEITRQLAREFNIPVFTTDISQFTGSGWKGNDLIELLKGLYMASNSDIALAQRGILVLDEIDKIAYDKDSKSSSTHNTLEVQNGLLKIIEGGIFDLKLTNQKQFDTSLVTVIGCGAFNGAGRGDNCPSTDYGYFEESDYIEYGFKPEFINRFKTFITINNLSFNDKKRYLLKSELSLLKLKLNNYNKMGIAVSIVNGVDSLADEIVKTSAASEAGIRGIDRVTAKIFDEIDYQLFDTIDTPEEIIISERTVQNPKLVKVKAKK